MPIDKKKWAFRTAIVSFIILAITLFILTVQKGFSNIFTAVAILVFATVLLFGIWGIFLIKVFLTNKQDNDLIYVHNPEQGVFKNIKVFKDWILITSGSFSLFLLLMWIASYNQVFLAAIPANSILFKQQITESGNILYNSLFPLGENIISGFIFGSILYFWKKTVKKFKLAQPIYWMVALTIIPIFFGYFVWANYHNLVYGANSIGRSITFLFGTFGAFITILTGSAAIWAALHFANNFFATASQYGFLHNPYFSFVVLLLLAINIGIFVWRWNKV